ncbi:MAG: glycosyltransferase involved in cell wall biosynthesis [Sphingobacteriales bacterium]|jgi:glycosyltransferase involved in cell wall biosynthesis
MNQQNTNKKFSVVLTSFNAKNTIQKTIESIFGQEGIYTEFDLELIVVDDQSTDGTFELLQNQENIKLYQTNQNTGGPNAGRNIGLENCTGDSIAFVDHDDIWVEDKLQSVLPYIDHAPILTSGYTIFNAHLNKTVIKTKNSKDKFVRYGKNETFIDKLSKTNNRQNTYLGCLIISKKLKNIRFEEHFGMVDFDWILKIFHQQKSIEICKPLYNRYINKNNLSLNENYRLIDFHYSMLTLEKFYDKHPRQVNKGIKRLYGSRARYYYVIGKYKLARRHFAKSSLSIKSILYYLTSFIGAKWVRKNFEVMG